MGIMMASRDHAFTFKTRRTVLMKHTEQWKELCAFHLLILYVDCKGH